MKRNWKGGLFRIVIVSFFIVMLVYELVTTEGLLKSYLSWNNGFIFALKIIIIPAAIVYIIWWAINWCIKGFKEPKLNINWEEGAFRLVIFLGALVLTGFSISIWVQTGDLVQAILFIVTLIVPITILGLGAYWINKGIEKPKKDKHHDGYDE